MTTGSIRDGAGPPSYTVLSRRAIAWWAVMIVTLGFGVAVWLLVAYGDADPASRARLEAVKVAATVVAGTGGAVALLLAARRQRSTEIALRQKDYEQEHQRRVADAVEADAVERRTTELYLKAADQLGSHAAPVRLAGLYALERLAQDNRGQRQTVVNVMCAYLRMPFVVDEHGRQEEQVRRAAQAVLAEHLRPGQEAGGPPPTFWSDIDLDLTGATLVNLDLSGCRVRTARFIEAAFVGDGAWLRDVAFAGNAWFDRAVFTGTAWFRGVEFGGDAWFRDVRFDCAAGFNDARFGADAWFTRATIGAAAGFDGVVFSRHAGFGAVRFTGSACFREATFGGDARFDGADFAERPLLDGASFTRGRPDTVAG